MKRNKKGFTLIELLAVIVILAIIALIAVPTIMGIINKANKSAFKDTAYGVISAAELYFAEQQLELNGMSEEKTFDLATDVNVEGGLQIKGEVPESGTLVVNTKGQTALSISNGRYCITKKYDDNDITVTEDSDNCYFPYSLPALATTSDDLEVSSVLSCATDGTTCNSGDAFAIKVNEEETYKFYVLNDDGEKVTLIMDRNLGKKVAWVSKADYNDDTNYGTYGNNNKGPITALNYLNSLTSEEWTNIPAIKSYTYVNNENGTTSSYGYQKLEITEGEAKLTNQTGDEVNQVEGITRARLLTYEEASTLKTNNNGTMPTWLYENLKSDSNTSLPYGYWFLTATPSPSIYGRYMDYHGTVNNVHVANIYGVRPVIELSK